MEDFNFLSVKKLITCSEKKKKVQTASNCLERQVYKN